MCHCPLQQDILLQPIGSGMSDRKDKPVIASVKSHSFDHSQSLCPLWVNTNTITLVLLPWLFIDYRNIAMTLIKEIKKKKKSQRANSRIKPGHFCIYRVRDHLCTCYILTHSWYISSCSGWDEEWNRFTLSESISEKEERRKPKSALQEQEIPDL